jgi:predicted nucleic acid-binding protein
MTSYVVDASIVIQDFVTDTYTPQVEAFFDQTADVDDLWVPEFCLLECANVLWKESRFRGMEQERAIQLARELAALPLRVTPINALIPRALQIGLAQGLVLYDSAYIALAERLACPLITVDAQQAKAAAASGVSLKSISDYSTAK